MSSWTARGLAVLSMTCLLAACGGGGSDVPAPSPSPSPSPALPPSGVLSTCGLPSFQAALMARVSNLRGTGANCGSAGNFPPTFQLRWSAQLTQAADAHSRDMAAQNYFSHTSLDGRTFVDRIIATGYSWSSLGENIAAGHTTVDAVMDAWIASPGHCANLMNPDFVEVGVACVNATGARYPTYWTMDLGAPR